MANFTFRGGIHPYDGKELTKDKPVKLFKPEGELIFPLSQHIGAPAKAVVKKGDRVLAGQKIGEPGGFVSAPVFSSISGIVKKIEPHLTVTGAMVESIFVENDGLYERVPVPEKRALKDLSGEEILARVREAGVVGMGGAGFPTHVKLAPKDPDKIDYVLVNGAECEPYLTSDYRRMMDEPEQVIEGLRVILKLFPGARGYICVEDNKMDCVERLRNLLLNDPRIGVKVMKTKYPQGAERMMIAAATGREINSSQLPADAGCIVDNVETVAAIYRAVIEGELMLEKTVTVTGDGIQEPGNFKVPLGTDFAGIIEAAGGLKGSPEKIIAGGPMMGNALFDLHVPVTKTTSAILCMEKDEVSHKEMTACINCGRCVSACPEHLLPARLADFALRHDEERFAAFDGLECCECGCCNYVCPAGRMLTQWIKSKRRLVLASRKKK